MITSGCVSSCKGSDGDTHNIDRPQRDCPCSRDLIGKPALKDAYPSAPSVLSFALSFLTAKKASHQ